MTGLGYPPPCTRRKMWTLRLSYARDMETSRRWNKRAENSQPESGFHSHAQAAGVNNRLMGRLKLVESCLQTPELLRRDCGFQEIRKGRSMYEQFILQSEEEPWNQVPKSTMLWMLIANYVLDSWILLHIRSSFQYTWEYLTVSRIHLNQECKTPRSFR